MDPDQYVEELAALHVKEDREYRAQQRKELAAFIRKIVRDEIARSETEHGDRIFPGVHK